MLAWTRFQVLSPENSCHASLGTLSSHPAREECEGPVFVLQGIWEGWPRPAQASLYSISTLQLERLPAQAPPWLSVVLRMKLQHLDLAM